MDVYDFIAILAMTVTGVVIVVGGWFLLELPGNMAEERHHPHVDAVRLCGWMGLATAGLFWAFAMVWALRPMTRTEGGQAS